MKVFYEEFYKAYNPRKADKQGIIYTPVSVVNYMIEACDALLYEHFDKTMASKGVEILDPCTGTGVFVTQILKYIEGNKEKAKNKFQYELNCNEVDLLPYYIANLNIEYIYKEVSGQYLEYNNLCLVDTLENDWSKGKTNLLSYAGITPENVERVKRQNERKISVVIGSPPYNAQQKNVNQNNKNKEY